MVLFVLSQTIESTQYAYELQHKKVVLFVMKFNIPDGIQLQLVFLKTQSIEVGCVTKIPILCEDFQSLT